MLKFVQVWGHKKMGVKKLFLVGLSCLLLIACSSNANVRTDKLTVYIGGCIDADITADLIYSHKGIGKFLQNNNISTEINETLARCGYTFIMNSKSEDINEVLTDYDLLQEASRFFLGTKK
jgi:hypothetical protein